MSGGAFLTAQLERRDRRRHPPILQRYTHDESPTSAFAIFSRVRKAEESFGVQLRKVAGVISNILRTFDLDTDPNAKIRLANMLREYSRILQPWARSVSSRMLAEVDARDKIAWGKISTIMGLAVRDQIENAPIGEATRKLLQEQVDLITSLPIEAAQSVHEMTMEAMIKGQRYSMIVDRVRALGDLTRARATVIARTETARTASVFMQVRAQAIGSESYTWRTSGDSDVRPSHRALNGRVFRWDDPPLTDAPDYHAHPGQIFNCFPASTKVSLTNGCHYVWRYWYEGGLVRVEFEGGFFEATPYHPILTRRGWIAAKDLQTSDHVVQCVHDSALALDDNEHEGQPTFGDLFAALDICLERETHAGFLFDFHGERPSNDVDQIRADLLLQRYRETSGLESVRDLDFSEANRGMVEPSVGGALQIGVARRSGGIADFDPIFGAHSLHASDVRLRGGAADDTMLFQNSRDREPAAAKPVFLGNRKLAESVALVISDNIALGKVVASVRRRAANAGVCFDATGAKALADKIRVCAKLAPDIRDASTGGYKALRVVDKSLRNFAGHVFTMQTMNGWFSITSAGIVAKNCRCVALPILPTA